MSRISHIFPGRTHALLPVIHVLDQAQASYNARIAQDAGCDGVFLINHQVSEATLLHSYDDVRSKCPGFWVGVNFLGHLPLAAWDWAPFSASGLWVDEMGIDEDAEDPVAVARAMQEHKRLNGPQRGAYFGGVAFKHQRPVKDLPRVVALAKSFADVLTTSGEATGSPPTVEKMQIVRQAAGDKPVAIASGIGEHNIRLFMPEADIFLVASSITDHDEYLLARKVRDLVKALRC